MHIAEKGRCNKASITKRASSFPHSLEAFSQLAPKIHTFKLTKAEGDRDRKAKTSHLAIPSFRLESIHNPSPRRTTQSRIQLLMALLLLLTTCHLSGGMRRKAGRMSLLLLLR